MTSVAEPEKDIRRYRLVVERILGFPLPPGAVVHHWDEDRNNNLPHNLVVCPSEAYHNLLHMRMEAAKASGDPNKLRCYVCKQYDDKERLLPVRKAGRNVTTFYHPPCRNAYRRAKYLAEKVK